MSKEPPKVIMVNINKVLKGNIKVMSSTHPVEIKEE